MCEWFHQVLMNSILDSPATLCRSFSSGSLRLKSIKLARRWLRRSCKCWPVEIRLSRNCFLMMTRDLRRRYARMYIEIELDEINDVKLVPWDAATFSSPNTISKTFNRSMAAAILGWKSWHGWRSPGQWLSSKLANKSAASMTWLGRVFTVTNRHTNNAS